MGPVVQPPRSPELYAPGVTPVWAVYTILLQLSLDCCWRHWEGLTPGQLASRTGYDYSGSAGAYPVEQDLLCRNLVLTKSFP